MINTPKSLQLHIAVTGRTNTGKSSLVNYLTGQKVSLTSDIPGTTTDVVEKAAELLPLGPVVFLDTAGCDDESELGILRVSLMQKTLKRADVIFLVVEASVWGSDEDELAQYAEAHDIPLLIMVNKIDIEVPEETFYTILKARSPHVINCSTMDEGSRDATVSGVKTILLKIAPDDFLQPPPLTEDLVPVGGHTVCIVPIDLEAPKGRLILPQVQTLRAILDGSAAGTVVKESEYVDFMRSLIRKPDLVICDSQVVDFMVANTPSDVPVTTFSILFARFKGDLSTLVDGARAIDTIKAGSRVLISEACTHHPLEDDIGRVKIPRWIEQYRGCSFQWEVVAGKDYPDNLKDYDLIIHCGGCMLNRRGMLSRIEQAAETGVPITNYGLAISTAHGLLERVTAPFYTDPVPTA